MHRSLPALLSYSVLVLGESGGAVAPATNAAQHGDEQTVGEALYAEGIAEAEHDRMTESRRTEDRDEI